MSGTGQPDPRHIDAQHIDDLVGDTGDLGETVGSGGIGGIETLAALAEVAAASPPAPLRSSVLEAVARRPRPGVEGASPAEVYRRRAADLASLLDDLAGADWDAPAAPYPWTVHGLVAHLTVIEEYTARQLGLDRRRPLPISDPATADHLATGSAGIDRLLHRPPGEAVERWRTAADRIGRHAASDRFDPRASVCLHGWAFEGGSALIVRSFELWTHTDDISRATGRPLTTPGPAELRTMSEASVTALPLLLTLGGGDPPSPTRVVLTGPGGGTYDLTGPEPHENLLVVDVVDYCRVVARRADPVVVTRAREGDGALLDALLRASQAIAM